MSFAQKEHRKTIHGGEGPIKKYRLYYSPKYKRKVVEKTVRNDFIRTKKASRSRLKLLMDEYSINSASLKKGKQSYAIDENFPIRLLC